MLPSIQFKPTSAAKILDDADILGDIVNGKLDDLDDDGEEAELALAIGDDVLPEDDNDESIPPLGMFDEH